METNPVLKSETETVIKVQYFDLEEFISQVTGHDYEIVASEEWSNDSQHRFFVDGILQKHEMRDWNKFKETGDARLYTLRIILNGLCLEKKILPGRYLITVCW